MCGFSCVKMYTYFAWYEKICIKKKRLDCCSESLGAMRTRREREINNSGSEDKARKKHKEMNGWTDACFTPSSHCSGRRKNHTHTLCDENTQDMMRKKTKAKTNERMIFLWQNTQSLLVTLRCFLAVAVVLCFGRHYSSSGHHLFRIHTDHWASEASSVSADC